MLPCNKIEDFWEPNIKVTEETLLDKQRLFHKSYFFVTCLPVLK